MSLKSADVSDRLDYHFIYSGVHFEDSILMTLDNKYYLYREEHPPSPLFIGSLENDNFNLQDVAFYGDYLSYIHEVPMVFKSLNAINSSPIKPLIPVSNNEFMNNDYSYYESIQNIYDSLISLRFNGVTMFKWEEAYCYLININLPERIHEFKKEIQLYSMGLKQSDPLSEFLCYYRVIESISGNNGKLWIDTQIKLIESYNFGDLELKDLLESGHKEGKDHTNIFSIYREKAISRLNSLRETFGTAIGKYLYNEVRCGIAHGKENIKVNDNGNNLEEIAQDTFIMKLLARIAIET